MTRTLLFLAVVAGLLGTGVAPAVQPERLVREDPATGGQCEDWSESDAYGGLVFGRAAELAVPWYFARSDALWVCASGYTSFSEHFSHLTDPERERIAAFLERHNIASLLANEHMGGPERRHLERWLASRVYALRNLGPAERALVERALHLRAEQLAGRWVSRDAWFDVDTFADDEASSPAARVSATFYRAAMLCLEGKVAEGLELAATIDDDDLAVTGLHIDEVCKEAR